ncbi:MAG: DMT family transporter, partial [Pseudomonadota bacterium]
MTPPSPQNPGALNWVLIGSLGVIWGAAFMLTSLALDGYGFWTVAAARNLFGALALWAVCAALGQPVSGIRSTRAWVAIVAIGLGALALPISLLSWGLQFVPSAFAGVAMGAVPLLVLPLVALFSPEEGIGPRRIIGVSLGFAGLALLLGREAFAASGRDLEIWGRLACLSAAACYAGGSIITRRAPKTPPLPFATATLFVASLPLVPIALVTEGLPTAFPTLPTFALILAALLPTALAAVIRVRVITTAGSLFMSLTSYQVPVWSVIFGIALMGETLPP